MNNRPNTNNESVTSSNSSSSLQSTATSDITVTRLPRPSDSTDQITLRASFQLQQRLREEARKGKKQNSTVVVSLSSQNQLTKTLKKAEADFDQALEKYKKKVKEEKGQDLENSFSSLLQGPIDNFIDVIALLKKPKSEKFLGTNEAKRLQGVYLNRIGIAYLHGDQLEKATEWFKMAVLEGGSHALGNICNAIEAALQKDSSESESFIGENVDFLLSSYHSHGSTEIQESALAAMLRCYLKSEKFEKAADFARQYEGIMTVDTYVPLVDYRSLEQSKNDLWHKKLLDAAKKQARNNSLTEADHENARIVLQNLLNYYLGLSKHLEYVITIEKYKSFFKGQDLLVCALKFITDLSPAQKDMFKRTLGWLHGFALNGHQIAIHSYLELTSVYCNKDAAILAEASKILEKALAIPEPCDQLSYMLGVLYDQGLLVDQDDSLALKHYKKSAEAGNLSGMQNYASMFKNGQGVEACPETAASWYLKAIQAGSPEAIFGLIATLEPLLGRMMLSGALEEMLNTAMKISEVNIQMLPIKKEQKTPMMARLAMHRAIFLVITYRQSKGSQENLGAEIEKYTLQAIKDGDPDVMTAAYSNLAAFYLTRLKTKDKILQAEVYLKEALKISGEHESASHDYGNVCSLLTYTYLSLSLFEKDSARCHDYQQQSLHYHLLCHEDEEAFFNQNTQVLVNSYKKLAEEKASDTPLIFCYQSHADDVASGNLSLTNTFINTLKVIKGSGANLPALIKELSEEAVKLSNRMYHDKQFIEPAVLVAQEVSQYASSPHVKQEELLNLIKYLSKWRLAPALDKLANFAVYLDPSHYSYPQLVLAIYTVAIAGFEDKVTAVMVTKLINYFDENQNKLLKKQKNLPLYHAALVFYSLALLDSRIIHEPLAQLAQTVFQLLKGESKELELEDISPIYHAYYYFVQKYPAQDWEMSAELKAKAAIYNKALTGDEGIHVSRSQKSIYKHLKLLNTKVEQEAFIPKAGRRVDFLIDNTIIQYNGSRNHYLFDANNEPSRPSPKDILCQVTLEMAGFTVVNISSSEWSAVEGLKLDALEFLKKKIGQRTVNPSSLWASSATASAPTNNNQQDREARCAM